MNSLDLAYSFIQRKVSSFFPLSFLFFLFILRDNIRLTIYASKQLYEKQTWTLLIRQDLPRACISIDNKYSCYIKNTRPNLVIYTFLNFRRFVRAQSISLTLSTVELAHLISHYLLYEELKDTMN